MRTCASATDETKKEECYSNIKIRFDAAKKVMKGEYTEADEKAVREGFATDRVQEMRKKWGERIEGGVKNRIENNFARFEATYNRLVKIADRIDSRLSKLKGEGIDVSVSATHLASARTDLSEARTAIASLKSGWNEIMESDTDTTVDNSAFEKCKVQTGGVILKTFPAKCQFDGQTYVDLSVSVKTEVAKDGRFEKLRSLAHTAKEELKSAHKHMVEAIRNIKPGQNDAARTDTIKANTDASVDVSN